jgi:serine/threonine protein kinase
VVFRDLKPANVLLRSTTQRLAVVDFGIARPFVAGEIGTVVGTPGYAPPEQYQGLATPESDVFALGATLHRLLTGYDPERVRPFVFPPVRSLNNRVSSELASLVEHALRLAPAERPSAQAMGAVLDRLSRRPRARPTIAPPPAPWLNECGAGISRSGWLRARLTALRSKMGGAPGDIKRDLEQVPGHGAITPLPVPGRESA